MYVCMCKDLRAKHKKNKDLHMMNKNPGRGSEIHYGKAAFPNLPRENIRHGTFACTEDLQ